MRETKTHRKEGRKREEWVGELRSMACHKRGLTNWRGGRGRSGLVSFEAWHVTSEDSLAGGEEEGGVGWCALKLGKTQRRTHELEGREREGWVGELRGSATGQDMNRNWKEERSGGREGRYRRWQDTYT